MKTCSLLICVVLPAMALGADQKLSSEVTPDPVIQRDLTALLAAPSRLALKSQIDQFLNARINRIEFLQQLAFFAANHESSLEKAAVGHVLNRFEARKDEMVTAIAPLLDSSNEKVRKTAGDFLHAQEDRSPSRPPDFSGYRAVVELAVRAGRQPQVSLITHMYASDPDATLLTLVRAFQLRQPEAIKEILWAQHVIAELFWKRQFGFVKPLATDPAAVEQIDRLSRHDRWWVRLYAARIIQMNPELGNPELVNRLAADGVAEVRAAVLPQR